MTDFLHPSLRDPALLETLRQTWRDYGMLRLAPLLADDCPARLVASLRQQAFTVQASQPGQLNQLFWQLHYLPQESLDPLLASFGHWLLSGLCALTMAITGRDLAPTPTGKSLSTLYSYGCYLDVHNDSGHNRSVAYVLGLTPPWSESVGGQLEFLTRHDRGLRVIGSRPPGWNSLDLFDVSGPHSLHRVTMLTAHRERRAFIGWFYPPSED